MPDADRPDDDTHAERHPAPGDTAWAELVEQLSAHSPKASRYMLEGEIARGGMGAIVKVWDKDLRRHLAMKVVLGKSSPGDRGSTPAVDDRTLGRFLEEAQVTGQLDHPGVVPVHELGIDDEGLVYFTMRLVKGRDLKAIFGLVREEKEGWNQTRALGVLLKACEALAYAHSKGVIHRDLKPANIMVGRFGEVYVMDWGLARIAGRPDRKDIRLQTEGLTTIGSLKTVRRDAAEATPDSPLVTMDGDVVGTPAYMSLEQARGETERVDARSDVYSMGAILYELLTGQMPYVPSGAKLSARTVLAMVVNGPPPPIHTVNASVPAELQAICQRAMSRGAEGRYADMMAMAEDLQAYLDGRVVRAYETGTLAQLRKWIVRNKLVATALFLLLALFVAAPFAVVELRRLQLERLRGEEALILGRVEQRGSEDSTAAVDRMTLRLSRRILDGASNAQDRYLLASRWLRVSLTAAPIQARERVTAGLGINSISGAIAPELGVLVGPRIALDSNPIRLNAVGQPPQGVIAGGSTGLSWGADMSASAIGRHVVSGEWEVAFVHLADAGKYARWGSSLEIQAVASRRLGDPVTLPASPVTLTLLDELPAEFPIPIRTGGLIDAYLRKIQVTASWVPDSSAEHGVLRVLLSFPPPELVFPLKLDLVRDGSTLDLTAADKLTDTTHGIAESEWADLADNPVHELPLDLRVSPSGVRVRHAGKALIVGYPPDDPVLVSLCLVIPISSAQLGEQTAAGLFESLALSLRSDAAGLNQEPDVLVYGDVAWSIPLVPNPR